ncbi:MAG TPA: hypothetical protein VFR15_08140, partial [Chloroflexia bacterium]|nr:hypothetical protein [Chloroflexia bacterium]
MSRQRPEDIVGRGLGFAVALGALALGVAAALMNSERTRQMREELRGRVDDLGKRVDELSAQAGRMIEERRPEIEETIERGRKVVLEGLDKAKSAVDQGAERAQEYVHRSGPGLRDTAEDFGNRVESAAGEAKETAGEWFDKGQNVGQRMASDIDNAMDDAGRAF